MNRARIACVAASFPRGQHASPRENNPNPATLPTAIPPPERPAPSSKRTTKPGPAIKAIPVPASIAASNATSLLVVTANTYLNLYVAPIRTP